MNLSNLKELVFTLASCRGVSGGEGEAAENARLLLSRYMTAEIDALGNVLGSTNFGKEHVLLDAHIDQIGFVVTSIDEKGFLKVAKCGGTDIRTLAAQEVTVWGREPLFGVITSTPPHLSDNNEKKAVSIEDTAIDIGFSREKAEQLVSPGDKITLNGRQAELLGGRICAPNLDDRAGVAVILRALELLEGKNHGKKISVLFSVQEETTGSGAKTGAFSKAPNTAIAVDVSFANAPGMRKEECGELGAGPMIGFSPTLDFSLSRKLESIASENSIPFQREIMGGSTGTNADKIQDSGAGVKTGLISIPLRNMHTGIETADLQDLENCAKLIANYILSQ